MKTQAKLFRMSVLVMALVLCTTIFGAQPLLALDPTAYFSYDYTVQLSKTQVNENETFSMTVTGSASCTKDFPLPAKEGVITGRLVAQHKTSGVRVVLVSSYTLSIPDLPDRAGQSIQIQPTTIDNLKYPTGSQIGEYTIIGEVIEAKVFAIFWVTVVSNPPQPSDLIQIAPKTVTSMIYGPPPAGGGGGGGSTITVTQTAPVTSDVSAFNPSGIFSKAFVAEFSDGKHKLSIREGTSAHNDDGSPLWKLTMSESTTQHPAPSNAAVINITYVCGPNGATFEPPIKLTLSFDRYILIDLPPGFDLKNLVVAVWDIEKGEWSRLPSVVDKTNFTITADVSHFSEFTILAPARPASFEVSGLLITPAEAAANEQVNIAVTVANTGDLKGNYTVTLKVDDAEVSSKDVSVPGGAQEKVTFTALKSSAGSYSVSVNGLTGQFTVKAGATLSPSVSPTPKPSTPSTPAPAPTQASPNPTAAPSPTPAAPARQPFNWLLVIAVLGGLVVIGIAAQIVVVIKKH